MNLLGGDPFARRNRRGTQLLSPEGPCVLAYLAMLCWGLPRTKDTLLSGAVAPKRSGSALLLFWSFAHSTERWTFAPGSASLFILNTALLFLKSATLSLWVPPGQEEHVWLCSAELLFDLRESRRGDSPHLAVKPSGCPPRWLC